MFMKKIFYLIAILAITLASCDKNEVENTTQNSSILNVEGLNVFNSAEELQNLILSSSTEQYNNRWKEIGKMAKVNSEFDTENQMSDSISKSEELPSELIPNENFRNIVNENGEFIVGNKVYKICKYGTLYSDIQNIDELRLIDSIKISNSPYFEDKLKKIGNIFLYETFATNDDVDNANNIEQQKSPTKYKSVLSTSATPNIDNFPVKSTARHTVVGKWRDALFGEDKWHYETIKSRRRLGAKLYDFNYIVYKESGFSSKVQHNETWFKTWVQVKSWDNGITIGWKDMIFKVKMPGMEKWQKPTNLSTAKNTKYTEYVTSVDFSKTPLAVGNDALTIVIPFIGEKDFSYADLQEMIYKFAAKKLVSTLNSARTKANGFMVDVPSQETRYIYIASTEKWKKGPELNHVFPSDGVSFEIFAGNGGDFLYYMQKSMTASMKMKNFELISGMAYAYTDNDNEGYTGMVIKKIAE